MKRFVLSTLLTALLSVVSLHAATTYNIVYIPGAGCAGPLSDAPLTCSVSLTPILPIGEFPTLTFTDWVDTDGHGTVAWNSVEGPAGKNLGPGQVQPNCHEFCTAVSKAQFCNSGECIIQIAAMTVFFEGGYVSGGEYAGKFMVSFSYEYKTLEGGSHEWVRSVSSSGGTVTITE